MQFESFSMNVFFFEGRASSFFFFKKHNFLPLGKKWGESGRGTSMSGFSRHEVL